MAPARLNIAFNLPGLARLKTHLLWLYLGKGLIWWRKAFRGRLRRSSGKYSGNRVRAMKRPSQSRERPLKITHKMLLSVGQRVTVLVCGRTDGLFHTTAQSSSQNGRPAEEWRGYG